MVQSCHAAYEVGKQDSSNDSVNTLVLLQVPNEESLGKVAERLTFQDIPFHLFREPDLNNQITSLCTSPVPKGQRKLFKKYELWEVQKNNFWLD